MDLSKLNNIKIKGTQRASTRNKVDIAFVIDLSKSMKRVINEIVRNINIFVDSLKDDANRKIDVRLGYIAIKSARGENVMLVHWDQPFTNNIETFKNGVNDLLNNLGGNEYTLIGIDKAADLNWEQNRHKFIIVFTDECVTGGADPEFELRKFDILIQKLKDLHIKIFYVGAKCKKYEKFKAIDGSIVQFTDNFSNIDFSELFERIGKSISVTSQQKLQKSDVNVPKNIYNLGIGNNNDWSEDTENI